MPNFAIAPLNQQLFIFNVIGLIARQEIRSNFVRQKSRMKDLLNESSWVVTNQIKLAYINNNRDDSIANKFLEDKW